MDNVYRYQRYIYDATRKYYLIGRDKALGLIEAPREGAVIEIGVGTGRNLLKLHSLRPDLRLFGFDASQAMLDTAQKSCAHISKIRLGFALAEQFKSEECFGEKIVFDAAIFSYSLSMIPDWQGALEVALSSVKAGGSVYIVDFWDQHTYPTMLRKLLQKWLTLFHVKFKPEWMPHFLKLKEDKNLDYTFIPIAGSYSFILKLQLPANIASNNIESDIELAA